MKFSSSRLVLKMAYSSQLIKKIKHVKLVKEKAEKVRDATVSPRTKSLVSPEISTIKNETMPTASEIKILLIGMTLSSQP